TRGAAWSHGRADSARRHDQRLHATDRQKASAAVQDGDEVLRPVERDPQLPGGEELLLSLIERPLEEDRSGRGRLVHLQPAGTTRRPHEQTYLYRVRRGGRRGLLRRGPRRSEADGGHALRPATR